MWRRAFGLTAVVLAIAVGVWLAIPRFTGSDETLGEAAARAIVAWSLIVAALAVAAVVAVIWLAQHLLARPARWVAVRVFVLAWRWWARLRYPTWVAGRAPVPGVDPRAAVDAEFHRLTASLADSYITDLAEEE
jgi:hypothetical protein